MRDPNAMERADIEERLKASRALKQSATDTAEFLETQAYVAECATDGAYIMVSLSNKAVRDIAKLLRDLSA